MTRAPQPEPGVTRGRRAWTYVLVWVCVMAVPLLGGRLAHLALAAFVAAVLTVVWWWLGEVGAAAETAEWSTVAAGWLRGRGSDPRAARLQRQIRDVGSGAHAAGSDVVLARSLVALIDDRVMAHHGVDPDIDVERFRTIVGADLAAIRAATVDERVTLRPRDIPLLISRIEQL